MKKALSFVIGAVIGGLVGATLAMLFTPESGGELRAQIRDRASSFGEEIRHAVTSKRIELQDRLESMRAPKTQ